MDLLGVSAWLLYVLSPVLRTGYGVNDEREAVDLPSGYVRGHVRIALLFANLLIKSAITYRNYDCP